MLKIKTGYALDFVLFSESGLLSESKLLEIHQNGKKHNNTQPPTLCLQTLHKSGKSVRTFFEFRLELIGLK
jgi:hypothetical protein